MMRQRYWVAGLGGILVVGALSAGCFSTPPDCVLGARGDQLERGDIARCEGPPAGCGPSENSTPVDESCGVFVSSSKGADGAAGTKSAPLKTLQKALDKANGRPVYACAEAFVGSVTLASGSAIFGGLDCTNSWA